MLPSHLCFVDRKGGVSARSDQLGFATLEDAHVLVTAAEHKVRADLRAENIALPSAVRVDAKDTDESRAKLADYWGRVQQTCIDLRVDGLRRRTNTDGADMGASGAGTAGNLTAYMWRIIKESRPPRHWQKLGRIGNTLAPGLLEYQLAFEASSGEAKVWAGGAGGDYSVSHGWSFATRPQYHFLSSASIGMIPQASYMVMGADYRGLLTSQAQLGHDLVKNRLAFEGGGSDLDVWGLKNYPTLAIDYTALSLATVTGAQLANALNEMIWGPTKDSEQAFEPDVLAVPMRVAELMGVLYVSDVQTVRAWFAENHPGVRLEVWRELDNLMGSGLHAMFAYPSNGEGAPTIESSPVILLPEVQEGIGTRLYAYSRYGGMVIGGTIGARLGVVEN